MPAPLRVVRYFDHHSVLWEWPGVEARKERGQLPATVVFHVIVLLIVLLTVPQIFGEPGAMCQVFCWAPGFMGE